MNKAGIKVFGGIRTPGQVGAKPSVPGAWTPDLNTFSVDFNRDEFTKLIASKGYNVTWEKAAFCPNRKGVAPKDHSFSCDVCDGTGFIYYDAQDTQMLMTGIKVTESFYAYGRWDGGSLMVTALPEYRINYWDRLTMKDSRNRFQEILFRSRDQNFDTPKYSPLCVSYVAWVDRTGKNHVFDPIADVMVDDEGHFVWAGTNKPDAGDYYTVAYEYRPRYVVMDLIHQVRDSPIAGQSYPFPVQAVAKLDFLVRDEGKDEPKEEPTDPFKVDDQ